MPSSMDTLSDAALPEHPTDNQELKIEESNAVSVEQVDEVSCLLSSILVVIVLTLQLDTDSVAVVNRSQKSRVKERRPCCMMQLQQGTLVG